MQGKELRALAWRPGGSGDLAVMVHSEQFTQTTMCNNQSVSRTCSLSVYCFKVKVVDEEETEIKSLREFSAGEPREDFPGSSVVNPCQCREA